MARSYLQAFNPKLPSSTAGCSEKEGGGKEEEREKVAGARKEVETSGGCQGEKKQWSEFNSKMSSNPQIQATENNLWGQSIGVNM